jgi:alpha-tubulin suppressor-like RCC1 family protein
VDTRLIIVATVMSASACTLYAPLLCEPCERTCGSGLACVEGVCVSPTSDCGVVVCDDGYRAIDGECVGPVDVAVGQLSACARWSDGRVSCWGWNVGYSLGVDDVRIASQPVLLDALDDVVELAMKGTFACARTGGGEVWCWGDNPTGQIGDRSVPSSATPVQVPLPDGFEPMSIATGYLSACATASTGHVHCWGDNRERQLGWGFLDAPAAVRPTADEVALGWGHGCLLRDGEVACWGSDVAGKGGSGDALGVVVHGGSPRIDRVVAGVGFTCLLREGALDCFGGADLHPPDEGPWTDVVAGRSHVCATRPDGELVCFGRPLPWLELDAASPSRTRRPNERMSAGGETTCLVEPGRPAECWGLAGRGLLTEPRLDDVAPYEHAVGLSTDVVGDAMACGLDRDDRVRCWGAAAAGRLGRDAEGAQLEPTPIDDRPSQFLSGRWDTACRVEEGGTVSCWGRNGGGAGPTPGVLATPTAVDGVADAVQVHVGQQLSCALERTGTVRCWGSGAEPRVVNVPPAVGLAVGGAFACALDVERNVRCWGSNAYGQADGRGGRGPPVIDRPVRVPELSNPAQIRLGAEHGCARYETGAVWCWGRNVRGDLGRGSTSTAEAPAPVPNVDDAVAIDVSYGWACAVRRAGSVVCWGEERSERFGRERWASAIDQDLTAQPATPIGGVSNAIDIVVGLDGACTRRSDGSSQCFGFDGFGTLSRRAHDDAEAMLIRSPRFE